MNIADDIWFEVCLRLPLTEIFKFRCVSKVWLSILSNPSFINQWYKLNISLLPWGLVHINNYPVEDCSPDDNNRFRRGFSIAYPDSQSQFISQHKNGFSLNFLNPNFPISNNDQGILVIGSSNGLVLCHTYLTNHTILYVCNPLTQKWVSLPRPPLTQYRAVVTGFMCNDDECFSSSLVSTNFKVIRIPKFAAGAKEFKVDMFSSELGEWNSYDVSCPPHVTWNFYIGDNLITHNGVFYWLQKRNNKILAVTVNGKTNHGTYGNECRVINLPDQPMDGDSMSCNLLGESEGLICYAIVKERERSLSIWVLEEDWILLCKDNKFADILVEMESSLIGVVDAIDLVKEIEVFGFNPFDKNVVILGYDKYIWGYNTKTKGYEQLFHPSFLPVSGSFFDASFLTFAIKPRPSVLLPASW